MPLKFRLGIHFVASFRKEKWKNNFPRWFLFEKGKENCFEIATNIVQRVDSVLEIM